MKSKDKLIRRDRVRPQRFNGNNQRFFNLSIPIQHIDALSDIVEVFVSGTRIERMALTD